MNIMSSFSKIFLCSIIATTIFVGFGRSALAQLLLPPTVQFETTPLFSEVNFVPGNSVSRSVVVNNTTPDTHRLITRAINVVNASQPKLGDAMELVIKQGDTVLYDGTLSNFFILPEVVLSQVLPQDQATLDFVVTFEPQSANVYQNSTMNFNLEVGFEDSDVVVDDNPGGNTGGGRGGGGGGNIVRINSPTTTAFEQTVGETTQTSGETAQTNDEIADAPGFPEAGRNIGSFSPSSLDSLAALVEKSVLFDVVSVPVQSIQQNPIFVIFLIIALILLLIYLLLRIRDYIDKRAKKKRGINDIQ